MLVSHEASSSGRNGGSCRGDRGRRRTCSDPWSAAPAAWRCARTSAIAMRSSSQRSDSPSVRRKRIERCQRLPAARRSRASTPSRPAGPRGRCRRVRTRVVDHLRPRQREDHAGAWRRSGTARTAARRRTGTARAPAPRGGAGSGARRRAGAGTATATRRAAPPGRPAATGTPAARNDQGVPVDGRQR